MRRPLLTFPLPPTLPAAKAWTTVKLSLPRALPRTKPRKGRWRPKPNNGGPRWRSGPRGITLGEIFRPNCHPQAPPDLVARDSIARVGFIPSNCFSKSTQRTNHGHLYLPIDSVSVSNHRNSLKGRVLRKKAMRSDDYRRLRETFVEMALQRPDSPERARWLAIAQGCLELERQPPVGHAAPAGPAFTSPTNGGTSEAPAPRRPAGQDRRPYGTAPPRSNVPNITAASIYRKLGA